MENSRLFERLRNLSIRDSLTELYNHRHVMELIDDEFQRVGRYPEGRFSLLMIDIDHFKAINDTHGHPAGDAVLQEAAQVVREALRPVDSSAATAARSSSPSSPTRRARRRSRPRTASANGWRSTASRSAAPG